jgi:hypothetical protein
MVISPRATFHLLRPRGVVFSLISLVPYQEILGRHAPNGWRYPLVGGMRQRRLDRTNLKPRKLPENAQTPTSRVHAVFGGISMMPFSFMVYTSSQYRGQ